MDSSKEHFSYDMADGKKIVLGSGMTGNTYRGKVQLRNSAEPVPAALKCFSHLVADDDDHGYKRLEREVMLSARLRHPNIVRFLRFFYDKHTPVIATEYVPGVTLAEAIHEASRARRTGTKDWMMDVLHWAVQLCWSLEHLETARVIHRDIKPANIIIREDDLAPILIDFGIGRSYDAQDTHSSLITGAAVSFVGTFTYASPEQLRGAGTPRSEEKLTHRTDIYSLGATLTYALIPHVLEPIISSLTEGRLDFAEHVDSIPHAPPGLYELLREMMHPNADSRPKPKQAADAFNNILRKTFEMEVMRPSDSEDAPLMNSPDADQELPGFADLGQGVEVATTLLSQCAFVFWHQRQMDRIDLDQTGPVARMTHEEAAQLVQRINDDAKNHRWTYRLPTDSEWFLAAGFPTSNGRLSTTRQTRRLVQDRSLDELEWCNESCRHTAYPECRRLCYMGMNGPQITHRHRKWPKGALRLVREQRMKAAPAGA